MKIEIEITEQEVKDLKAIRNYFGEHDKTLFEHKAYAVVDSLVKKLNKPAVINSVAAPEWLTTERRAEAKMKYESHVFGDSNRVKAVEMIRMWAGLAGYTIGLKKASELLQQHCL